MVVRRARGQLASVAEKHQHAGLRPRSWRRTNQEMRSMAGDIAAVSLSSITSPRWRALVQHALADFAPHPRCIREHPKQLHLMQHPTREEGIHRANHHQHTRRSAGQGNQARRPAGPLRHGSRSAQGTDRTRERSAACAAWGQPTEPDHHPAQAPAGRTLILLDTSVRVERVRCCGRTWLWQALDCSARSRRRCP